MAYVKIDNGVVVQKQPYPSSGFIEAPDYVTCGYLYDGSQFTEPDPVEPIIDPKLVGVEILGVMCSATRDDQNGLSAVALGVTLARSSDTSFPSTRFQFENGNELVISDENFDHVYSIWVPFRQSFFAAT